MRGRQFFKASNFLQVSLMFSPALLQYTPFSVSRVYISTLFIKHIGHLKLTKSNKTSRNDADF